MFGTESSSREDKRVTSIYYFHTWQFEIRSVNRMGSLPPLHYRMFEACLSFLNLLVSFQVEFRGPQSRLLIWSPLLNAICAETIDSSSELKPEVTERSFQRGQQLDPIL